MHKALTPVLTVGGGVVIGIALMALYSKIRYDTWFDAATTRLGRDGAGSSAELQSPGVFGTTNGSRNLPLEQRALTFQARTA